MSASEFGLYRFQTLNQASRASASHTAQLTVLAACQAGLQFCRYPAELASSTLENCSLPVPQQHLRLVCFFATHIPNTTDVPTHAQGLCIKLHLSCLLSLLCQQASSPRSLVRCCPSSAWEGVTGRETSATSSLTQAVCSLWRARALACSHRCVLSSYVGWWLWGIARLAYDACLIHKQAQGLSVSPAVVLSLCLLPSTPSQHSIQASGVVSSCNDRLSLAKCNPHKQHQGLPVLPGKPT